MKKLLIMRHAEAGYKNSGGTDFDRPLNNAGKDAAERMGLHLQTQNPVPELILSSPAQRTKMTAERIVDALSGKSVKLRYCETFYLAEAGRILQELAKLEDEECSEDDAMLDCVLVIGHNPGVSELVHVLTGGYCEMPPAAVATVELPIMSWGEIEELSSGAGHLVSECHPGRTLQPRSETDR